tara:strand:- start:375 stop:977 length:603 start_codon:yes stop_codon:yes gene_type:complete
MFGFSPLAQAPVADDTGIAVYSFTISDITTTPISQVGISQTHILTATEITTGAVLLDTVTIAEDETFSIPDIVTGAPTFSVSLVLLFEFNANEITSGAPIIDSLVLEQQYGANDIIAGTPIIDTIAVAQSNNFIPIEITTTPTVDSIAFTQTHILTATEITAGTPTIPVRFLWDVQEITPETWTNISGTTETWTVVQDAA